MQRDARPDIEVALAERLPLQLADIKVVRQVKPCVDAGSGSPEGVFKLIFVYLNFDASAEEMLEAASIVEMQLTDHDGFDILDVVTRGLHSRR